jgi:hypothetical protein
MTVTQLLKNITAPEIVEWSKFFLIKNEKLPEQPQAIEEKVKQFALMAKPKKKKK